MSRYPQLDNLVELLLTYPPPFIYIHDPLHARPTPSEYITSHYSSGRSVIRIDLGEILAPKMLYDLIIDKLGSWEGAMDAKGRVGCWESAEGGKWDKSWDAFVHALREVCGVEEMEAVYEDAGVVLVLERAEKLKETASLQPLLVPLIRLGELARFSVTTIFISSTPWSDLKPLGMNTPDPFTVRLSLQPKQVVIGELDSQYPNESPSVAYHRNLRPLYSAFLSVLYDSCNLYTNDPHEIAFMAHTMWPVFIRPLLEEWKFNHEENGAEDYKLPAKASDVLIPRFRLSFSRSFPPLHARTISARAFLKSCASAPSPRLSQLVNGAKDLPTLHDASKAIVSQQGGDLDALLSRRKKLMLVAAYIASFNPPRTDLRMFGRVAEGSSKKGRRRGGGGGSTANRKKTKISQTLLGPNSFALERFIAIYGSLVTEHGDENLDMEDLRPGELEVEVHRAGILMAVTELTQARLLLRISPADKIDSNLMLRCNITFEAAERFARDMKFSLTDLLWDPVI